MTDWVEIRNQYAALRRGVIYLDCGEVGLVADPVLEAKLAWERLINAMGPATRAATALIEQGVRGAELEEKASVLASWGGVEQLRTQLASELGVAPSEMFFARNTTEALASVLGAIDWQRGDRILITDAEHDSTLINLYYTKKRRNVEVEKAQILSIIDSSDFDTHCVEAFLRKLDRKTRLVVLSDVLWNCGAVLPVENIVRACKDQNRDIHVLVDGAHSLGHLPVNLQRLHCDFYISAGHKWLGAPKGSGVLFVKGSRNSVSRLNLRMTGAWAAPPGYRPTRPDVLRVLAPGRNSRNGSVEIDGGTIDDSNLVGLSAALLQFQAIGAAAIQSRNLELAGATRECLRSTPSVQLVPRSGSAKLSGIVSFTVGGIDTYSRASEFVEELQARHNLVCRAVPAPLSIRVCLNHYNSESDVEALCHGLAT